MADPQAKDYHKATHPEFTIRCDRCGSQRVYIDKTLGFSAQSGSWGNIAIVCADCGSKAVIFGDE